jgi:predicted secreted protein
MNYGFLNNLTFFYSIIYIIDKKFVGCRERGLAPKALSSGALKKTAKNFTDHQSHSQLNQLLKNCPVLFRSNDNHIVMYSESKQTDNQKRYDTELNVVSHLMHLLLDFFDVSS